MNIKSRSIVQLVILPQKCYLNILPGLVKSGIWLSEKIHGKHDDKACTKFGILIVHRNFLEKWILFIFEETEELTISSKPKDK